MQGNPTHMVTADFGLLTRVDSSFMILPPGLSMEPKWLCGYQEHADQRPQSTYSGLDTTGAESQSA